MTEPTMEESILKVLRDNTFSGLENEDENEHTGRVLEIVDLFTTPDVTHDQLMLCVFPISLTTAASRWLRNEPAGSITTREILKGNFLSKYCPPFRTAKRMEEINNFQQEPYETLYQAWERFKELLLRCPQVYFTNMQEADDTKKAIQEMANYSQKWHNGTSNRNKSSNTSDGLAGIQAQLNNLSWEINKVNERVRYRAAAPGFYQRDNGNPSYQERRQTMEESLSTLMAESTKRHDENSSLIMEIRASTDAAIKNQGDDKKHFIKLSQASVHFLGPLKEYEYDEEKVLKGRKCLKGLMKFQDPIFDRVCYNFEEIGIAENVLVGINKFVFPVDFIVLDMPEDIKIPLILERSFLSTSHAKIDVFKRKFALRIGDDKIVFKSDGPTSNIIKKVYVLGLRERMELDLEAILIGEALILNRTQDPKFGYFLELNNLNEPLELRNHKNEDLDPESEEGEIIDEPMFDVVKTRHNDERVEKIDKYHSFCDYDRKIHINCAYNLQFSCMIGYEHVNANFFLVLSINVMSKSFYNSIMKEKIEYKGKNVVGTFINVHIFVGNFSIITNFTVIENMDAYQDENMGDVIFGKPFCRDTCVE
ncbi:putative reverse transcriptase domain-containing protein, partial [Tanacetum coccineum]